MAEEYSRYLQQTTNSEEKYLCQCKLPKSFGKFCEYLLPTGDVFETTAQRQAEIKQSHKSHDQVHEDIVCYTTLLCDSGLLCLDWRDICDGLQQCMFGYDEENCDKLEFNECDNDEYRCMNGMCIPDEYFLDGDYDCMDLSDEIQTYDDSSCVVQQVNLKCDDRLCPPHYWSCGEGQCIENRLGFQQDSIATIQCKSRREQYYMCETHSTDQLWTLPNGKCYASNDYRATNVTNRTLTETCIYLLKCALSRGAEESCSCRIDFSCIDMLERVCSSAPIRYPEGGIITPYILQFYNVTRDRFKTTPDFVEINSTLKCRGNIIHKEMTLPYSVGFHLRDIEASICADSSNNHSNEFCHNESRTFNNRSYNFIDICHHPQGCISAYRINDGVQNCADGMDEKRYDLVPQTCSSVKRHRFRCSPNEPTCLPVSTLGDLHSDCQNDRDESWMGTHKLLSEMICNNRSTEECESIRQYIETSWQSDIINHENEQLSSTKAIPFHAYCDTFWNLGTRKDEDIQMCRNWWICPDDQWQCGTGQCISPEWILDGQWDCSDASDEEGIFASNYTFLERNLKIANRLELENKFEELYNDKPFGQICNLTVEYPCFRVDASGTLEDVTRDRFCISLQQIGDGQVDCIGGLDERNVLKHCHRSSMLGDNFKCLSSDTCIDYSLTCETRCPNMVDDQSLCYAEWNKSDDCSDPRDFVCLNHQCVIHGWCNGNNDCNYGEDEYLCNNKGKTTVTSIETFYRRKKEADVKNTEKTLQLSQLPGEVTRSKAVVPVPEPTTISSSELVSSRVLYVCNRGVGVYTYNKSIACFCPQQYYGDKCQFHSDRMAVLLHLNFAETLYTQSSRPTIVLKMLLVFLFENQTLMTTEFHVRPAVEFITYTKKIDYMLYSRSPSSIQHKRLRHSNRSNIIHEHPYSLRIEAYKLESDHIPEFVAVWQYPIYFDYLPSFRFAKVLRLKRPNTNDNPCSRKPCKASEECHQLLNNETSYVCLCPNNFTGENCSKLESVCVTGFCHTNSICKPSYRGVLAGNELPYCICPYNTFGRRCELTYDACTLNSCANNDTCFPLSKSRKYHCICTPNYHGIRCEMKRPFVHLYINETNEHQGAVVQYFSINFFLLDLILLNQSVFKKLPDQLHFWLQKGMVSPEVTLIKLYSETQNEMYLVFMQMNSSSINTTIQVTEKNRCARVTTSYGQFINTSVFMYHHFCINNKSLMCFQDDAYLCICNEKHSRVECFTYNSRLDHCSRCVDGSQCIQGDRSKENDYICFCTPCRSGQYCQFTTQLSILNYDQYFITDLQSKNVLVQRTVYYSLIVGSWILFLFGLANNTASFFTFRRRKCHQNGIGQYLLYLSVVNQIVLGLLACRVTRLAVNLTSSRSSPIMDNVFCKLLSSLLSSARHITYWLTSFIAIERSYIALFLNGQWLNKPNVARFLILLTCICDLTMTIVEFIFRTSSDTKFNDQLVNVCSLNFLPSWALVHQAIVTVNTLVPFFINLCCTIIIICVVTKKRMNTVPQHSHNPMTTNIPTINLDGSQPDTQQEHTEVQAASHQPTIKLQTRLVLLRDVLSENKELLIGPVFTLIPQLFSVPTLVISFLMLCHKIETSPLRYLLITLEFLSYIPQVISFFLYISSSSFYSKEWRATKMSKYIAALNRTHQHSSSISFTVFSIKKDTRKY